MPRRTPRGPGRPSKLLDPQIVKTLVEALRLGVPVSIACQGSGVSESAFYGWMQRGWAEQEERTNPDYVPNPDEQPHLDLFLTVTKARSEAAMRNVGLIQKAAQGGAVIEETTKKYRDHSGEQVEEKTLKRTGPDWRAAAWYLERAHRSEFAKGAEQVEISGPGGGPVSISGEEIDRLSAKLTLHIEQATVAAIEASRRPEDEDGEGEDVHEAEMVEE
jgi:hypothetical protein